MAPRTALLGSTAVAGAAAAWTVTASATFLYGAGLWDAFPFPSVQFFQYLPYAATNATVEHWLKLSAAAATLTVGALVGRLAVPLWKRSTPLHGRSAYADKAEAKRSGLIYAKRPRGDSVLLGQTRGFLGMGKRYICLPGDEHVALAARTGSGKTVSFATPNAFAFAGSLVVLDVKGEIYRETAGHRTAMGQTCVFFSPSAPDQMSHRYNPFSVVPRGESGCIDEIHRIMHLLIRSDAKAEDPFWTKAARALAAGGAIMLAETPGEPLTLTAVLRMFSRPDHERFIHGLIQRGRTAGKPLPQVAVDVVMSWLNNDDAKTKNGVLEELKAQMALYASPQIAAATAASDFDVREMRKRGVSLYIGTTATEFERLQPLMAILFTQLVSVNTRSEPKHDPTLTHSVLMLLDEFWSAGPIRVLATAASFVRSYGIRMAYIIQSKEQVFEIYGKSAAENLFVNTGAEIFFGIKGLKQAREVSEMAGNDTVTETTRSRPRFFGWAMPGKQSENDSDRRRALLLPQEVQRLPKEEELIFRPHTQAIRCRRILWFNDPWFNRLKRQPPSVPRLNVKIDQDDGSAVVPLSASAWAAIP